MSTISERLGISNEIHELKFGKSFTNASTNSKFGNKNSYNDNGNTESFHTIRYDFKPVSVDTSQTSTIEFNEKNKITVTAPNVEGSGVACTVFQGSRKPHLKECVLVFDHETGDFTLERLTNNIVVKKTRAEGSSKSNKIVNQQRPITPAGLNQKSVSPKLNNIQLNGTSTKSPPNSNSANNLTTTTNSSYISSKDKLSQQKDAHLLNSMPIFDSSTLTQNSRIKNNFDNDDIGVLSSSSSSEDEDENEDEDEDDSSSSSSSSSSSDDDENRNVKLGVLSNLATKPIVMSASSSESDSDDEKLTSLNNNLINSLNNGLSNVGISKNQSNSNGPIGFSMPKLSDLNDDLQLSEDSGSD